MSVTYFCNKRIVNSRTLLIITAGVNDEIFRILGHTFMFMCHILYLLAVA